MLTSYMRNRLREVKSLVLVNLASEAPTPHPLKPRPASHTVASLYSSPTLLPVNFKKRSLARPMWKMPAAADTRALGLWPMTTLSGGERGGKV